jgi:hypothetical protein
VFSGLVEIQLPAMGCFPVSFCLFGQIRFRAERLHINEATPNNQTISVWEAFVGLAAPGCLHQSSPTAMHPHSGRTALTVFIPKTVVRFVILCAGLTPVEDGHLCS